MGLFKRGSERKLGIYFATDIHGSELCFKKFLAAADFYGTDIAILGGDMTGKMIVPLIHRGNGSYEATMSGQKAVASSEEEAVQLETKIRDAGFYPYRTEPDEVAALSEQPERVEEIFHSEMESTLRRWGEFAEKKYAGSHRIIYVAPGNDDPFFIDEVIAEIPVFQLVEDQVVTLPGDYEMLSTGYSNRTPWDTHREVEEEELREKIDKLGEQLARPEESIFNIHVPPYGSTIDEGPDIEPGTLDQRTSMGRAMTKPVGSRAVNEAIERWQPMLSLHGHIHESRGVVRLGQTMAINPGSDYGDSVLRGAIVLLQGGEVAGHQLTSG